VPFRRVSLGKTFGALGDLNHALLAFALLAAGSRNSDAQRFRVFEQRRAGGDASSVMIEVQLYAHATPAIGAGRHNNRIQWSNPALVQVRRGAMVDGSRGPRSTE
jgi:hypothetical protein